MPMTCIPNQATNTHAAHALIMHAYLIHTMLYMITPCRVHPVLLVKNCNIPTAAVDTLVFID
jgi:hypothetical protein